MGVRSAVSRARPRVRGILSPADVVTLGNLLCGFFAIVTLTGDPGAEVFGRYPDHLFAIALIMLGAVGDAFDGMVARRYGSSSLGKDLDTLADAVTLVVAPALLLMFTYGAEDGMPVRSALVSGLVVMMGILRLARFNSGEEEADADTFDGFPTPVTAGGICALVIIGAPAAFALSVSAVLAMLMMSNVSYPKNRYSQRIAVATMAAALFIVGGIIFLPEHFDFFAKIGFVLTAFFVAIIPFMLHRRMRKEAAEEAAEESAGEAQGRESDESAAEEAAGEAQERESDESAAE